MAVISWDNYVDDSTVDSYSAGEATSPIIATESLSEQNLKTRQIGDIFRYTFAGATTLGVSFDLGSAKKTTLVGILNHNMQGLAYAVRFGTTKWAQDVGAESGTFAATTSYDAPNDMLYYPNGYTAQFVTIFVTIPDQSPWVDRTVDIGRVWIDNAWVPDGGVGMDFAMGIVDRSPKIKSNSGSTYASRRQILRKMDVNAIGKSTADFIGTSSDFDSFLTMDLAVGTHDEIICLPLTDSQHNLNRLGIYGTISNNGSIQVRDKGADGYLTTKRFTIEEDRG